MGRSRVSPKPVTIPRLELTAAVVGVELKQLVRRELDLVIRDVYFWTDSTSVLHYVHSTAKRCQVFVANRIATIQAGSDPLQWRHVPTSRNPADLASRGALPSQVDPDDMWFKGPDFLWLDVSQWPSFPDVLDNDSLDAELKSEFRVCAVGGREVAEDVFPLQRLIKHCSSFFRLRSLVGWLLRFRIVLAAKCRNESLEGVNSSYLTVNELKEATLKLVKFVQRQCYSNEFASLQELGSFDDIGKCHSRQCPRDSSLRKLSPVVVNGVLRLGGRLQRSPLPPESRHPIILPSKPHFSELIIAYYHVKVGHSGVLHTLAATREYYWILHGHAAVKRVVGRCTVCRRTFARPGTQIMAPLPNFRVTPGKPAFTCVGLDFEVWTQLD